jgi:hypothetical protein
MWEALPWCSGSQLFGLPSCAEDAVGHDQELFQVNGVDQQLGIFLSFQRFQLLPHSSSDINY